MQAFQTRRNMQDAGDTKMLRVSLFFAFILMMLMPTQPANAGWAEWHSFWNRAHKDKLRNNSWPAPFQKADRATVCQTLSVQLANGWKRQNTLSGVYFDQDTHALNEAGRRKLYSIVTSAPEAFNTIYVVQSMNPAAQERRVASIKQTSSELFAGMTPDVMPVRISPPSWSADYIDNITRQVEATIPSPRLPAFQSTTGQ